MVEAARRRGDVHGVVLCWNDAAAARRAVESLRGAGGVARVIVVDNGSAATEAEALDRAWPGDPFVTILRLSANRGFAGGVNAGAHRAFEDGAALVLFLNSDAVAEPGAVSALRDALESDPGAGAAAPLVLRDDGSGRPWFAGGTLDRTFGQALHRTDVGSGAPRRCDFLTFCCVLVTREAWTRTGPLDEEFFAYYEDADWCRRAALRGEGLLHCPAAVVRHRVGGTTVPGSPLHAYLLARGRVLYVRRHVPILRRVLLFWPWMLVVRLPHEIVKHLLRGAGRAALASACGVADGRRGGPPRRFRAELGLAGGAS